MFLPKWFKGGKKGEESFYKHLYVSQTDRRLCYSPIQAYIEVSFTQKLTRESFFRNLNKYEK